MIFAAAAQVGTGSPFFSAAMLGHRLTAVPPRSATRVRVLVVDDHALFAEALMLTLAIDGRIEVVGQAASGAEAVSLAEALQPDVVLMDVHMPGMDGIEATLRVRDVSPRSWVVMVTAARSPEIVAQAFAAGASCFLTKDTPALQLIDAILETPTAAPGVIPFPVRRESGMRAAR